MRFTREGRPSLHPEAQPEATAMTLSRSLRIAPLHAAFAQLLRNGTLRLAQTSDGGDVSITIQSNGGIVLEEPGVPSFASFGGVSSLLVVMADGSSSALELHFDAALAGDLDLELGSGDREVLIAGGTPTIGGDLTLVGGTGRQTVDVTATQPVTVGGDFGATGINRYSSPGVPLYVGGNLRWSMAKEVAPSLLDPFYLFLGGSLAYKGSSDVDQIDLGYGQVAIAGSVKIDLGDGVTGTAEKQFVHFKSSGMANSPSVAGSTSIRSGDSTNGDEVVIEANALLQGGLKLALGGGDNSVSVKGSSGKLQYSGGSGVDRVSLGLASPSAKVKLGDGDDTFSLMDTLAVGKLAVDFGPGTDSYEIEVGTTVPAGAKLKNLP
jgi:hypothetical protein